MWYNSKFTYRDNENRSLTVGVNEDGEVIIKSEEGIYFENEEECLCFIEVLKKKVELMFTETEL